MKNKLEEYKRYVFAGIIIISLGITFSSTLKDSSGSLGTVFIAIGGLLLIMGMNKKKHREEGKKDK